MAGDNSDAAVLRFWFEEVSPDQHFAKDPVLDGLVAKRFGALLEDLLSSAARGWLDAPEALLAAVIMLDQFSRLPRSVDRTSLQP